MLRRTVIFSLTLLAWAIAVVTHAISLTSSGQDEYGFGTSFLLLGFTITIFPFYLAGLIVVLFLELSILFGMKKEQSKRTF